MQPRGIILDVDGVLTDTASRHERAWKALFDPLLAERGLAPFSHGDYLAHVDGKPRVDGLRDFLASRRTELDAGTLDALAARKQSLFEEILRREGVQPFEEVPAQLRRWRAQGVRLAAASSSRNMRQVLAAASLRPLLDAEVDGTDLDRLGLPGKPAPDLFLQAARRLGVAPASALVVEDAASGVQAGLRGGFGQVVGLARDGHPERLIAAGAHRVVRRLTELDSPRFASDHP